MSEISDRPDEVTCRQLVTFASDYLDGLLDPAVASAAVLHIAECGGCAMYLDQLRSTVQIVRATANRTEPAPPELVESVLAAFRTRLPQ